jgi:hypothetical protein
MPPRRPKQPPSRSNVHVAQLAQQEIVSRQPIRVHGIADIRKGKSRVIGGRVVQDPVELIVSNGEQNRPSKRAKPEPEKPKTWWDVPWEKRFADPNYDAFINARNAAAASAVKAEIAAEKARMVPGKQAQVTAQGLALRGVTAALDVVSLPFWLASRVASTAARPLSWISGTLLNSPPYYEKEKVPAKPVGLSDLPGLFPAKPKKVLPQRKK